MRKQFKRAPYNYLIKKKLNIRKILSSVSLENDILSILVQFKL